MKTNKFIIILAAGLALCACGRSKQAQFYMLNPVPPKVVPVSRYNYLKIGIDSIRSPAFTEKPQLMIYNSYNRVQLEEFHQWAESLDKNIKRVVKTNLTTLLPRAVLEEAPWDVEFKPDYTLKIVISEFKVDLLGNSSLRANYMILNQGQVIKKYEKFYHMKLAAVTIEALVRSMNSNLNHLTQDIAKTLAAGKNEVRQSTN
ncbi:hypothetical protein TUM19329_29910 [Legionella antarctica]|uniref:ABC-type transport auxiliary lipoprotein component domain-containing protein n=1 Tax=Legionella antarctica TaxID=2708020 RepID=A0A6F8T8Z5_9GAMM|nr:PqiC family protein [Legionella antarctica]BCA96630.1 hypothetical protein TUM19329_29910 [Legionella antarctica]